MVPQQYQNQKMIVMQADVLKIEDTIKIPVLTVTLQKKYSQTSIK
jgi:hypothetical protein